MIKNRVLDDHRMIKIRFDICDKEERLRSPVDVLTLKKDKAELTKSYKYTIMN